MTTSISFDNIYQSKLKPRLEKAEKMRKQILVNYTIISVVIMIGFALEAVTWMSIGIAFVIIFVLAYTNRFGISKADFLRTYQSTIGLVVTENLIASAMYDFDSYLKLKSLNEAYLISGFPIQYGGKHLSTFKFDNIQCAVSEIECHSHKKNEKGLRENYHVFGGLTGVAEIKFDIIDPVLIMSNRKISETIDSAGKNVSDIIKRDEFSIYNPENPLLNMLISPAVWMHITQFSEKTGTNIFLSITKNGICIAVDLKKILDAGLLRSVYQKEKIRPYFETYQFITTALQMVGKRYQETGFLINS